jgi:PncC family amidohydrolase
MDFPTFNELRIEDVINSVKKRSHENAYELLKIAYDKDVRIVCAESLTAGLMFSTLVDIPFFGWNKYGSFVVYDTDAKIKLLGVNTLDVYTHECAKQMAIGALKNSDASFAISVTGNASPDQKSGNIDKIGEVFIGIAGYSYNEDKKENEIIVKTQIINVCHYEDGQSICNIWYDTILLERILIKNRDYLKKNENKENNKVLNNVDGFNSFETTSLVSTYIRYRTIEEAFKLSKQFINKCTLNNNRHFTNIRCINENCDDNSRIGDNNSKIFRQSDRNIIRKKGSDKGLKLIAKECKGDKIWPITLAGVYEGAHYYKWINPQQDPDNVGFFEYYDENKYVLGIRKVNIKYLKMKWKKIDISDKVTLYNCGFTTIDIKSGEIPIGTVFGWNHKIGSYGGWIYLTNEVTFIAIPYGNFLLEKNNDQ